MTAHRLTVFPSLTVRHEMESIFRNIKSFRIKKIVFLEPAGEHTKADTCSQKPQRLQQRQPETAVEHRVDYRFLRFVIESEAVLINLLSLHLGIHFAVEHNHHSTEVHIEKQRKACAQPHQCRQHSPIEKLGQQQQNGQEDGSSNCDVFSILKQFGPGVARPEFQGSQKRKFFLCHSHKSIKTREKHRAARWIKGLKGLLFKLK